MTRFPQGGPGTLGVSVREQKLLEEDRRKGHSHTSLTSPFSLGPAWDPDGAVVGPEGEETQ